MSIRKLLLATLAPHLPVLGAIFGAIFGVTLMAVSAYFDNATMFFLSIIIISVLPPVLEAIGNSIKEKYGTLQNEVDIIAMIPEWSLGLEMLLSIAIMVVSAVFKNFTVLALGAWLLALGDSLNTAKEINGLKEDLWSSDSEKRRIAMEKVKLDEQDAVVISLSLFAFDVLIILFDEVFGSATFTLVKVITIIALLFAFPIPCCIVCKQADKVMPPDPEKATNAAS